jgi:hypothetical protein
MREKMGSDFAKKDKDSRAGLKNGTQNAIDGLDSYIARRKEKQSSTHF